VRGEQAGTPRHLPATYRLGRRGFQWLSHCPGHPWFYSRASWVTVSIRTVIGDGSPEPAPGRQGQTRVLMGAPPKQGGELAMVLLPSTLGRAGPLCSELLDLQWPSVVHPMAHGSKCGSGW
jgi:hypothetical protein